MRRQPGARRELLIAVISTFGAAVSAIDLVGHPARTVHILTIFAGGLAAGISLARAIERIRAARRARESTSISEPV